MMSYFPVEIQVLKLLHRQSIHRRQSKIIVSQYMGRGGIVYDYIQSCQAWHFSELKDSFTMLMSSLEVQSCLWLRGNAAATLGTCLDTSPPHSVIVLGARFCTFAYNQSMFFSYLAHEISKLLQHGASC